MTTDLQDLLAEYALGTLDESDRARVEAILASSADATNEVARVREALAAWGGERSTNSGTGPEGLRQRLLRTLGGIERFAPFFSHLRVCFDLDQKALTDMLTRVDAASGWLVAPFEGVTYFHFEPGPACGKSEAGVVRLVPGAVFPMHRHLGDELAFVLEGELRDRGKIYGPGSIVRADATIHHEYQAGTLRDLVLVSAHNGFEIVAPPA